MMTAGWMALLLTLGAPHENFEAARGWFEQGIAAMDAGKPAVAAKAFQRSLSLRESPATLFNLGAACRKLDRFVCTVNALSRFEALAPEVGKDQRRLVQSWLTEALARVVRVKVVLTGAPTRFEVDGVAREERDGTVDMVLLPGAHRFWVVRPGFEPVTVERTFAAGKTVSVALDASETSLQGILRVEVRPDEALIKVDGIVRGSGAFLGPLSVGMHAVEVTAERHLPVQRSVDILAGQEAQLRLTLEPEPMPESAGLTEQWWFWTAVSVVIVGAAVGTTVALTSSPEPDGGSLGRVVEAVELGRW